MKHPKKSIRAGDWFGCGRVITQESWDGFIAAQKAYWKKKDLAALKQARDSRDAGLLDNNP